ncbi:glycosyltransferase [Naumannella halotolerans]|uniref:UDP-N-acetylglucosamine:LPS N-acetylglucosamine transferase n=1 Tax=Naumannella halotolerans TaxID=993414 RepID=A0A4R7J144_9ACTN|nr:glycosyltransferase [Naumannella halotolerans]TDT29959.1 UDP-N-acetylglucosamine:LPS N-acetylglucosamine transferase [Naumannella halotolerans]
MTSHQVDILVVTDARLVGGGNKSLAQEIIAHAAAGYTTGLLSLSGPARGGARPLDVSLMQLIDDGLLQMFRPDDPIEAGLVIARGPSMFEREQSFKPRVRAEKWLLVANAFNTDPAVSNMLYDPNVVAAQAEELFDHQWQWVPLSPIVRHKMLSTHPKLALSPMNWSNIINLDHWHIDRSDRLERPVRIGRHSRDSPGKWPTDRREIFDAYPAGSDFRISIMGGARTPRAILGRPLPRNWDVFPFGAMSPKEFLRKVDVYSYYHHPAWHEAFGRSILEGIATGAVAVLPPYFEAIFSDAAIYAEPSEVKEVALRLAEDPSYLQERRAVAREVTHQYFGYGSHVERLKDLIGAPRRKSTATTKLPRLDKPTTPKPRVLFYTDNGHGLGHVTRLMAYAKRLGPEVQPYFLTMSEAYHLVDEQGHPVEYFPSPKKMGFTPKQKPIWEEILNVRLRLLLDRLEPSVLVVDHVNPPEVLRKICADHPDTTFVWSRRGMWRQQRKPPSLRMADAFDHVLEPMDLAAAVDMGFTPRLSAGTLYVPPITFVQRDELLPREQARAELGLPLDGTSVLLNLSADSTDQLVELMTHIQRLLRAQIGEDKPLTIFAPRHALHAAGLENVDGIVMKPVYPVAKYANAFDAAISTTGYNSYHELVHLGVPTIFVARATETLDDQNRRAAFAPIAGFGASAQSVHGLEFDEAVRSVMNPRVRARMRKAALEAFPENGANQAARIIERLVRGEPPTPHTEATAPGGTEAVMATAITDSRIGGTAGATAVKEKFSLPDSLERMPSGISLPSNAVKSAIRVVIDATTHGDADIPGLVDHITHVQLRYPYIKPVFLISALNSAALTRAGYMYETVVPADKWEALGTAMSHSEYVERRFYEMITVYQPQRMARIRPGEALPRWIYER